MKKKIIALIILILIVIFGGTAGFMLIEGKPFLDSLFMTMITLTTVGYGEVWPLSDAGRIFDIILMAVAVGILAYCVTAVIGFMLDGRMNELMHERRKHKLISRMNKHYIICGSGRTAMTIAREFDKTGMAFVIIAHDKDTAAELEKRGWTVLVGDSTDEETLCAAGIERAHGILVAEHTDAESLYCVLSCRQLNSEAYIVSKIDHLASESKFKKCGANATVSPSVIGGNRMATLALNPSVINFADLLPNNDKKPVSIIQVEVRPGSALDGQTIMSVRLRERTGVTVLAILGESMAESRFNPAPDEQLAAGVKLLIFGTQEQIRTFNELFHS